MQPKLVGYLFEPEHINLNRYLRTLYRPTEHDILLYKKWAEDGRSQYKRTEMAAVHIPFKFGKKRGNFSMPLKESKSIDGHMKIDRDIFKVGIRSLTKNGVRFQSSISTGGGRTCSKDVLIESLKQSIFTIVCDICPFGKWTYWVIENRLLVNCVRRNELTTRGWQREGFYNFLEQVGYDLDNNVIATKLVLH